MSSTHEAQTDALWHDQLLPSTSGQSNILQNTLSPDHPILNSSLQEPNPAQFLQIPDGSPSYKEPPSDTAAANVFAQIISRPSTGRPEERRSAQDDHVPLQCLLEQLRKVSQSREDLLLSRAEAKYEIEKYREARRHVEESQIAFMRAVDVAMVDSSPLYAHQHLKSLHQQLQDDQNALRAQSEANASLENALSNQEYRLAEKEAVLFTSLEKLLVRIPQSHIPGLDFDVASLPQSRSEAPSTSVPSILEEYYDKAGDVSVMKQRLDEADAEYEEEYARRQFRREHELPIEPSDEEFDRGHSSERTALVENLRLAEEAAEQSRQACIAAGHDPDHAEIQYSYSETPEPDGHRDSVDIEQSPMFPGETMRAKFAPFFDRHYPTTTSLMHLNESPDDLVLNFKDTRDRINRWLLDVLRQTRTEVLQYKAAAEEVGEQQDYIFPASTSSWADLVYDYWSQDEGAHGSPLTQATLMPSLNRSFRRGNSTKAPSRRPGAEPQQTKKLDPSAQERARTAYTSSPPPLEDQTQHLSQFTIITLSHQFYSDGNATIAHSDCNKALCRPRARSLGP
ncbi:hypothetical protein H2203_004654 [Taxawa tesnikishii (nom. ined.)]|nr:hypothetical protein H2203_004654 [Dothideales sp. JES 119]